MNIVGFIILYAVLLIAAYFEGKSIDEEEDDEQFSV